MADEVKNNRNLFLIAAGVLALGVIIGGYLLGDGLRRARMADRAVTMRGLAERKTDVSNGLAAISNGAVSLADLLQQARPQVPTMRSGRSSGSVYWCEQVSVMP